MVPGKMSNEDDKNRGDYASRVYLQRQVGTLAAIHLAAHHALGVLHRDAPLGPLNEDDNADNADHHGREKDQHENAKAHPAG